MAAMATPVASRHEVDEMRGALGYFLYGQGAEGFAASLPPDDHSLLVETHIVVRDHASGAEMKEAGTPPGSLLLGLYTYPPRQIRVFAGPIIAAGYEPTDVLEHELGHCFGFDHSTHPVNTALYVDANGAPRCTSYHPELATAAPTPAATDGWTPRCIDGPFCRLHARTAEANMLMVGLRQRAWLAAQPTTIPLGLGGTIPLARLKLSEAQDALRECAAEMPDRTGEIRDCDRLLQAAQAALAGTLDTAATTTAQEACYAAWNAAYSLNHAYWLHRLYPQVADIHDVV